MDLSRRDLLARAGAGVIVVALDPIDDAMGARGRLPLLRGGRFDEGVLSGDPSPDGITLLTRLNGVEGRGGVRLEIARDRGFNRVVARSVLRTDGRLGHSVKARVSGLDPHTEYWYRFEGRTARSSRGRFRTSLPRNSRQPVTFGVFAGQQFGSGYFNAQRRLAGEDLDFVLNLGNYISAGPGLKPPGAIREVSNNSPARTLAAYRRRYRDYRRDPALRAMHAAHPIISSWDDGEVAPGYAGRGGFPGPLIRRAAYRAWFESMPHYPKSRGASRIYHSRRFGASLDLFVLDTRQYRTDAPCGDDESAGCEGAGTGTDLLGPRQHAWLRRRLGLSLARWRIIASPAAMTRLLREDGTPHDFVGWSGYPAARDTQLRYFSDFGVENCAWLSSGLRRFLAAELFDPDGPPAPPEFGCAPVTAFTAGTADAQAADGRVVEADAQHHGYLVVRASRGALDVSFRKLETVRRRDPTLAGGSAYRVRRGSPLVETV